MDYLQDKQHYIDRYDLFTIKKCLEIIDVAKEVYSKMLNDDESNQFSAGDKAKGSNWITNQQIFHTIGERYRVKEETIRKWMLEDQVKQDKYDTTPPPQNIRCPECNKIMHSTLKDLDFLSESLRMMFIFECTLCKKRMWIYEDGTERKSKPFLCPKCNAEAEMSSVKEDADTVIWKTICKACGFTETTVDDFKKSRSEREKQEEHDRKLLDDYREHYCSEENGKKYLDYVESLKVAAVVYEEELSKYDSPAYEVVSQLKKLSVIELEKLLSQVFEKEQYTKLSIGNPEIGQNVIVSFTLQDADSTRKEKVSIENLLKILKRVLEGTNWRLMSDGLTYRLGYISGRLKGYEREEEFFELSGKKKEVKPSKIDSESRMKYQGSNTVQIARLNGEFEGIERVRKRRLAKEPNGFFLDSPDASYTCGICKESTPGNKTWWNLDGVRCADCQRNIEEGVIPAEIHKNTDIWIPGWQLSADSYFGINASVVRKLRRIGLLHGRDLKRADGTVYCTVYLVEENTEFLEKYPRKPKQNMTVTDLLGNKVEL